MVSESRRRKTSHGRGRKDYGKSLVLLTMVLVVAGLVVVYSATAHISKDITGDTERLFMRQAEKALFGILLMIGISRLDYRKWGRLSKFLLWVSFALLLGLLILPEGHFLLGPSRSVSARRWYNIFGLSVQPSEFARFAVIVWAADTAVRKGRSIEKFVKGTLPFIIVMAVISFLVVIEPDLSQAILISLSLLALLYLAGSRSVHIISIILVGIVVFFIFCRMEPYRWKRVKDHLGLSESSEEVGYQGRQSRIAIGSGGIIGAGGGAGKQKLKYLPEAHKDFIFAIIGEEFGFIGAALLVMGYAYFGYLGLRIARTAKDRFGFYLSSGLVVMIILGATLNMLVVTVIFPATGLTLPFISYGGSSLVVSLMSVGVLRNIARVSRGVSGRRE
ncbi:MAG: putative lipid II flippase FtsW [Candidatus Glassbacteria bacterium]